MNFHSVIIIFFFITRWCGQIKRWISKINHAVTGLNIFVLIFYLHDILDLHLILHWSIISIIFNFNHHIIYDWFGLAFRTQAIGQIFSIQFHQFEFILSNGTALNDFLTILKRKNYELITKIKKFWCNLFINFSMSKIHMDGPIYESLQ